VDQALIGAYEDGLSLALQAVTPEACSQRQLRTWFQQELITPIGTRGLVFRGEEETAGVPNAVVDVLDDVYLLRRVRRGDDVWYELAHDRLVDPIGQANHAWQQDRLSAAPWLGMVEAWEKQGHPEDLLLRGEALREALEWWMAANPWELSDQEVSFLDASLRLLYSELGVNLDERGWGAIFGQGADPRIQSALKELLEYRQAQAGDRYVLYAGKEGYRQGELAADFLRRHGIESQGFPHYLLVVGSPAEIPYEFQYALAERHAVGRIHFSSPDEYARYARSLVTAERGPVALAREAVFFNAHSPGDQAMQVTVEQLTQPLARRLLEEVPGWRIRSLLGEEATKARLRTHLGGAGTPALFFYAGHGLEFAKGDPLQPSHQGALLCADWPGSPARVTPDVAFSGDDLAEDARLLGLIAFLVGPHTAGTPRRDDFAHRNVGVREPHEFADQPFLACLPQRLLGHPNGGALAVIGHVDRAWLSIFQNRDGEPDIDHFVGTLTRLMSGHTVSSALEPFRHRRALLATRLGQEAAEALFAPRGQYGQLDITSPLIDLRTRTLDSRNYIIIGDPAARLPPAWQPAPRGAAGAIAKEPLLQQRPVIDPVVAVEDESVGLSLADRLYELDAAAQRLLDRLQVDSWIWQVPRSQDQPDNVASEIAQVLDSFRILGPDAEPAPQTLYRLAMLAAFRGDEELAVDCLRQATRADPDYGQAFEAITWLQQRRSRADIENKDYDAASAKLQEARHAAQKWRLPERALLNEGYIAKDQAALAAAMGDPAAAQQYWQEAETCFQRAIEVNPYDASALNGLGNLEYQAHNYSAAVDLMERAIALAPNYTYAYHDLGAAAMQLMRQDPADADHWCRKALAAFEEALSLAQRDGSFTAEAMRRINRSISWLRTQCGPQAA
jgi:tetratricopeptide (TPR) repeat protein